MSGVKTRNKVIILKANDYKYCIFPFDDFNRLQDDCYQYFCQDVNLVVSASVASGKTVVHEAIAGYELSRSETSKVVYVCPLKSLLQEKIEDWHRHETFSQYSMVALSSDAFVKTADIANARIIVATIESMNVCCRRGDSWLRDIRLFTFDEAHLFNHEKRGSGSEALLMSIGSIVPECRLLLLSGTLSNCIGIAKWIKVLNGKPTAFVNSTWRPTKLIKRVEVAENIGEQVEFLKGLAASHRDEKLLFFVHSKKVGEKFVQDLRLAGIRCAFYCADIDANKRKAMLDDFRNDYGSLNVLVCTSALAMGVNL